MIIAVTKKGHRNPITFYPPPSTVVYSSSALTSESLKVSYKNFNWIIWETSNFRKNRKSRLLWVWCTIFYWFYDKTDKESSGRIGYRGMTIRIYFSLSFLARGQISVLIFSANIRLLISVAWRFAKIILAFSIFIVFQGFIVNQLLHSLLVWCFLVVVILLIVLLPVYLWRNLIMSYFLREIYQKYLQRVHCVISLIKLTD